MLKKYVFTFLFISWVLLITVLSLFSFSGMELDAGKLDIPYADKITHFIFYLMFSVLGCLFVREQTKGDWTLQKTTWYMVSFAIAYGILIEVLQYTLTEDRMAEMGDVLANTIGAIAGIGSIRWYFSKERQLKWKI
ncbi:VanZ family protein [Flagellimonas meishanensis]|uniref:VanZ family protein n=1 Tax=Flagellimonas meishanensis TaxID=2873264 RepID=UPI001CA72D2C|nr:VanZ family protein [[Muricauda] meishanensis]